MNMVSVYLKDLIIGFKKDWFRLPNVLSQIRLLGSPIPGIILLLDPNDLSHRMWASAIFALLALTDFFDGKLARRLNQSTEFGRLLDPIADIFFGLLTLIALSFINIWALILLVSVLVWKIQGFWAVHQAAKKGKRPVVRYIGKVRTFATSATTCLMVLPNNLFYFQSIVVSYVVAVVAIGIVITCLTDFRDKLDM